jgi:hypothetical protein
MMLSHGLIVFFFALAARAGEIVLLLERTPGMEAALSETEVPRLRPGDRMAVMTFAHEARLRQDFTAGRRKLERAVRRPFIHGRWPLAPPPAQARVFHALAKANALLAGRGGAIVLLFGSEDLSGADPPASLGARLYAVAVRKTYPLDGESRNAQTPPTMPGRAPPVSTLSDPLPEATLERLRPLTKATGGEAIAGRWNLPKLVAP